MPAPIEAPDWYSTAMNLMLSEGITLRQAVSIMGLPLTDEEVAGHLRRSAWKKAWDVTSRAFFESKGSSAAATQDLLVGKMLADAEKLRDQCRYKEAGDLTASAAKVRGLVGADTSVSIWGTITGSDLERAQELLRTKRERKALPN